jgi:hypothetical protein
MGMPYEEVLALIKRSGRPLQVSFLRCAEPAPVSATFSQSGSLGLRLVPDKSTPQRPKMVLAGINPGTQAEQHPQLRVGLVVTAVAGVSVADSVYEEVLGLIKAGGRPLTITFVDPKLISARTEVASVAPPTVVFRDAPPAPTRAQLSANQQTILSEVHKQAVFHAPGPLGIVWTRFKDTPKNTLIPVVKEVKAGSAAAKAGVARMATLVTVNDKLISAWKWDTLIQELKSTRPLSLGLGTFSPASSLVPPAIPVSAVFIPITVTFVVPGPLGLALVPVKHGGPNDSRVLLKEVKPTSPVAGDKRLLPGMRLTSLQVGVDAAVSCMGMPYEEVLALIKRSGRPLQVSFRKFADTPAPAPASAQGGAKLPVQVATLQVSLAADNVRALQAQDEKELSSTPVAQPTPQQQAVVAEMQCAEEMQLLAPAAPQAEPETRPEPETHLGISSGESAHQMESDSAVDRLSDPGAKPQLVAQLELGSISSGSEEEANHDAEEALAMVGHMD